jgi:hypothetical protein
MSVMGSTHRDIPPTVPATSPAPAPTGCDAGWPTWLPGCEEEWAGVIWAEKQLARAKSAEQDAARFLAGLESEK